MEQKRKSDIGGSHVSQTGEHSSEEIIKEKCKSEGFDYFSIRWTMHEKVHTGHGSEFVLMPRIGNGSNLVLEHTIYLAINMAMTDEDKKKIEEPLKSKEK